MSEHKGATDQIHEIELESKLQRAGWLVQAAAPGTLAPFEVVTLFVGDGAAVTLELKTAGGKKLSKLEGTIGSGRWQDALPIPKDAEGEVLFEVELPKHKLKTKSEKLRVTPTSRIRNAKWDREEARRGDVVKLSADVEGFADGAEVNLAILEWDDDGGHDPVTTLSATVRGKRVEAQWEYEYHEDSDEIPTAEESEKGYNPPEYFFRAEANGVSAESEKLRFQDWVGISLALGDEPAAGEEYVLKLPDGSERKGKLDDQGKARESDVPPGPFTVTFPRFAKKNGEAPA